MLHHEIVDFLIVFGPPLLLIMRVVEIPLPFRRLDNVGWVRGISQEGR